MPLRLNLAMPAVPAVPGGWNSQFSVHLYGCLPIRLFTYTAIHLLYYSAIVLFGYSAK